MSELINIIAVQPPAYEQIREEKEIRGYCCPVCNGRGGFTEEIGRDRYETAECDYCQGAGKVKAEIVINWKPDMG